MGSIFDEILQRAEKLNTDVRLGKLSEFRLPSTSVLGSTSACTSSLLDAGLDDIFQRSEEIWSRKQSLRSVPPPNQRTIGMGASLRASKDLNQLSTTRLSVPEKAPQKPIQQLEKMQTEYEGVTAEMAEGHFPDSEIDQYVQRAFERARIEAERTFLNQQILEKPAQNSSTRSSTSVFSPRKGRGDVAVVESGGGVKHFSSALPNVPLSAPEQNVFAQKVDNALSQDANVILVPAVKEALKRLKSKEADYIWTKVFSVFPKAPLLRSGETVREMRSSKGWLDHIIGVGTQYLESELENHMEATIEANLVKARRGGIPGTLSRIAAFLNVKQPSHMCEDGLHGAHPRWLVLFYCIRLGDLLAAAEVAKELFNIAQCSTLVGILANLPKLTNIDGERRVKLRAEWKQNAPTCQDVHKRAVYGLFLGFDCPAEVSATIEDWLWAKLFSCNFAVEPTRALRQLQTTICAQHGEKYFVGEGGSHLLYFCALLLTGQLERAIQVLFRSEHRVHAVHVGIIAHQLRLVMTTEKVSDEMLVSDVHEASICALNLARLVLLYVKDFELSNVCFAINYCFFLRNFKLDGIPESKKDRSVFEACVSRIVYLSGERDAILGQLNVRGDRMPGLIDKFAPALDVHAVIRGVAFDTNVQGDPMAACHLYALAKRSDDAIKLISCQLSECIAKPKAPETLKAVECARWLAQRCDRPNAAEEDPNLDTLLQLLQLHTFFTLAVESKHQQAIELIQTTRTVPMEPDDVQAAVAQFHEVPNEVRPLLPALFSQLMRSIVSLYEATPADSPTFHLLKQFAKALILYTATLPYRFPVSTNSLLLQLQSKLV